MSNRKTGKKPGCPKCGHHVTRGGQSRGVQRYRCGKCKWNGCEPANVTVDQARGVDRKHADRVYAEVRGGGPSKLVITAAQNATPINKSFFASLQTYCKKNDAQLVVIPYRYKNPTSMWSEKAEHDDWWAPEVVPYMLDRRTMLNSNLVLLADIKTQPTATSPLQGFETVTGSHSAIIGHPNIELKSVPTPQSRMAKLLTTTGAITTKNYIESKAGKKAEHHHSFGAAVVELSGKKFHLRQLNATRDGSFIDLATEYDGGQTRSTRAEALIMGDTHQEFVDPDVIEATFGRGGIVETLNPKYLIWHDLHDFASRNHHDRGEVFRNYVKHHTGNDNVEAALRGTFAFLDRVTPAGVKNIIVPSNHPDALARWIKETDPRSDPENCIFWAETFSALVRGSKWTDIGPSTPDPFAYWGKQWLRCKDRTNFLRRGESFLVKGIDCGFHSDKGPNGGPGTLSAFSKIGVKTVTGHRHSPGITGGAYGVGTNSRIPLGYILGQPNSWMHTDCVIYENSKRSLINIIDGEWRA